jgi:hypothetical protein
MARLRDAAVVGYLRGRALGDIVQQRGQKDRLALLVGEPCIVAVLQQFGHHHLRMRPDIAFGMVDRVLRRGLGQLQLREGVQAGRPVHRVVSGMRHQGRDLFPAPHKFSFHRSFITKPRF